MSKAHWPEFLGRNLTAQGSAPTLYRAYAQVARRLRSDPVVHELLFGNRPSSRVTGELWDWTTLALKAALRRHSRPGESLLDMGTGPAGVLAIYARKELRCGAVVGVDHVREFPALAADTAARCGAEVAFHPSSLFSAVQGRYDLIVFNAPYIAAADGRRLGTFRGEADERRWSGGDTGLHTIDPFLRGAPAHLSARGLILLGVNHFYVSPAQMRAACVAARLLRVETVENHFTRACVYALRPAGAAPFEPPGPTAPGNR